MVSGQSGRSAKVHGPEIKKMDGPKRNSLVRVRANLVWGFRVRVHSGGVPLGYVSVRLGVGSLHYGVGCN